MPKSLYRRSLSGGFAPTDLIRTRLGSSASGSILKGFFEAPTGSTTFFKTLAGILTSSAVANKRSKDDTKVGSITLSGTLTQQIKFGKAVAGSLTLASTALVKRVRKQLKGTLTGLGAVRKRTQRATAGSVALAASIARRTRRRVTGTLTPSGIYADALVFFKTLAGSSTAVGTASGVKTVFSIAGFLRSARGLYSRMSR